MPPVALDTLVVGAGISGLACAHERLRVAPGEELLVLEGAERPGGLVRTLTRDGFRFEQGPEALPSTARVARELCAELDLPVHEVPPAAVRRYLALDGKLHEVPASPEGLATSRILSFGAKLRLMGEIACARDQALDGSIADFARHRFGAEALERVVDPIVAGIYAGDPEQLSLRACFPEVARAVEEHGSVTAALKARSKDRKAGGALAGGLWKPAHGMESLVAELARRLGARLRTGTRVTELRRTEEGWSVLDSGGTTHVARRLVLAVPLGAARPLLAGVTPEPAAALASMEAEGLVSVVHGYRRADVSHPLDGFGYLVPRKAAGLVMGTLFSSTIDPAAAPEGHVLLRSMLGGARRPDALSMSDDELLGHVASECSGLLGIRAAPVFTHVGRWPDAIPRFDLGHPGRRVLLAEGLPPGLAVLGNFTRGLGVESLVSAARGAAQAL